MFAKAGISLKMTDSDIKYLLWKSKNRLKNSDSELDIINKIARIRRLKTSFAFVTEKTVAGKPMNNRLKRNGIRHVKPTRTVCFH